MEFTGQFHNILDSKGRVSIPQEFRQELPSEDATLVLTQNREGGLTAFSRASWEVFRKGIESVSDRTLRTQLTRLYIAPHAVVGFDGQGRIPINKTLRIWSGLNDNERNVVVVGNEDRIDIFSEQRYAGVLMTAVDGINEKIDALNDLGLP